MAVILTINGQLYHVTPDIIPIDTTLNSFIRNHAHLTGTKFMCLEGSCGVCTVNVAGIHPVSRELTSFAVNSCLMPVYSCHGMDITTIEGIGSKVEGYHPIQQRLARFNGTQCGGCSPGMVMNMYGLMESSKGQLTMEEIEKSFAGNVCRCTGYRPIMDAMKSFATDACSALVDKCRDIEDLGENCSRSRKCQVKCARSVEKKAQHLYFEEEKEWHKVYSVDEVFGILKAIGCKPYSLVAGCTGQGVYRDSEDLKVLIDINSIEELHSYWIGRDLIVGANVSLTEFTGILNEAARSEAKFKYCEQLAKHVALIGQVSMRNVGTIAGNLCLKNKHRGFNSDLHVILAAVGARLTITNLDGSIDTVSPEQFVRMHMDKKMILNITFPPMHADNYAFRSYRVEPRAQNGRPYINGAFLVRWCGRQQTIESAAVCFGGINPTFTHAIETEKALCGKNPFNNDTLQKALAALELDLKPVWDPSQADPDYRKQTAIGIFYKFILSIAPRKVVDPKYKSGATSLEHPLSSGSQSYKTFPQNWPLTKNIPKLEAFAQTAGEAAYINDMPTMAHELFAAFVVATKPRTFIKQIDVTEALKIPGVVQFLSARNIPGNNNFMPSVINVNHYFPYGEEPEEIFCTGKVLFHGQPVGVILAESFQLANRASKLVCIEYSEQDGPILPTLQHVLQSNATDRIAPVGSPQTGPNYETSSGGYYRISGQVSLEGQYHYTLETQTCICVPKEDGMDVYCATQDIDHAQVTIAGVLKLPQSKINVMCRRIGGAFGSKITRSSQVAGACALAAYITQRPVRFWLTMESNMGSFGKRKGSVNNYEVSIRGDGKIAKLTNTFIYDCGAHFSEPNAPFYKAYFPNSYDNSAWKLIPMKARTDAPTNIWCRSPGAAEAVATIETIMEHIAFERGLDPLEVRMVNFEKNSTLRDLLPQFRKDVDFDNRKKSIETFNETNRWKKRGISIVPLTFPIEFMGGMKAWVSVHHLDGSVSICHGGVEMGQGLNTKMTQIAAHILAIPMEKIAIKPHNTLVSANSFMTAGSFSSDQVGHAVMNACQILVDRMKPIRDANPSASWEVLVSTCFTLNVNLTASYWSTEKEVKNYKVYALGCSEIELDVLTGNIRIARVDILEDTGESLSPGVDIGQIEGAFIMGTGYYFNESLQYDPETGALLNSRALSYKPPGPKDIPTDFRIKLLQSRATSPAGVLRSKATGEPAFSVAVSAVFALRQALMSARKDADLRTEWIPLGQPATPDRILHLAGNSTEQYLLSKCAEAIK
ncbi:uncharacterized protein LOC135717607 [Ochlerotatus camptorhynchus]|uniref:uncharacterized protein LOC135717607 n=1 Tax=Ochlerotatus camptorhynchus TaxID=644619 RepID=UPI0031DC957C